ncbi:MAG: hypothetical protein K2M55_02610 [Muribaculaceae bacterium]|nr:hypothetical protein [Muribaculaceae bacterium]
MKKDLLSLLFLASSLVMCADDGVMPRNYSIVPPAPEVASLMDFKDYPVDYFHGIPSISFPIYTLKSGSIEVPITLCYHGGGVRADQKTGNAGLSWSVMCGATISHTVYGAPDDANLNDRMHGFYHLDDKEKELRTKLTEKLPDYDPTDWTDYKKNRSWIGELGQSYYNGCCDLANDIFSFSGCNMSGTFVRDKSGKITLSSDNPVKITSTPDIPHITDGGCDGWGFRITDNAGIQYDFLTQDRTRYVFYHGNPMLTQQEDSLYYASAWHLDKIKDLSNNEVNFSYKRRSERSEKAVGGIVMRHFTSRPSADFRPEDLNSLSSIVYYPQLLESVEANGIKVKFNYIHEGTSRADALIGSIDITSPDGTCRTYTFNYDYNANLLMSVKDGEQTVFSFDYNRDYATEQDYFCQDFGGYINENGSESLIPNVILNIKQVGGSADRSVSRGFAHSLELQKITYPSGGSTEFEWENNTFGYFQSAEYKGTISPNEQAIKVITDTLRYCENEDCRKLKLTNYRVGDKQRITIDFTKYFNMNPTILWHTAYEDSHSSIYYNPNSRPYFPHVVITNRTTGEIEKVYYLDKETIEINGKNQPISLFLASGYYDFELFNPYAIQGAESDLRLNFQHGYNAGEIYINGTTVDTNVGNGREYWCGLRIKRIKSVTGDPNDEPLRKYFYYDLGQDPNKTSGTIQMLPKYDYMHYLIFPDYRFPGYLFTEVYCVGGVPFPNTMSGTFTSIEYPEVFVCMGKEDPEDPDNYLRTKAESFIYSSSRSVGNCDYNKSFFMSYQPIGSRMYTSLAHHRGNLMKHTLHTNAAPFHTTEYSYNIYESENTPLLTTDAFVVCDFTRAPSSNDYGGYDYGIGTYTLIPYNKTVSYTRSVENDGIDSQMKYEYFYDSYTSNTDYNLVKSTTETDASGLEITTYYTYVSKNGLRLPYPETVVTACGTTIVSAERTEYDANTMLPVRKYILSNSCSLNDLISPNGITTSSQKSNINQPTLSYKYNSFGNLIEISYDGVVLASYIWGYNGLYPVLEATGVDFNTLTAATAKYGLLGAEVNARGIASDARISAIAKRMREYFPGKTITAISYDWFNGILRQTDGRGIDTKNEYDSQGRLTSVRDFNNYLISKYDYHYATDDK